MKTNTANGSNGREIVAPAQSSQPVLDDGRPKWPSFEEMLQPKYKNGQLTWEPVSLKIQPQGTYFRVTVHMPTLHQELCFVVVSLATLEEEIERQIASGRLVPMPDWESRERARQGKR